MLFLKARIFVLSIKPIANTPVSLIRGSRVLAKYRKRIGNIINP